MKYINIGLFPADFAEYADRVLRKSAVSAGKSFDNILLEKNLNSL